MAPTAMPTRATARQLHELTSEPYASFVARSVPRELMLSTHTPSLSSRGGYQPCKMRAGAGHAGAFTTSRKNTASDTVATDVVQLNTSATHASAIAVNMYARRAPSASVQKPANTLPTAVPAFKDVQGKEYSGKEPGAAQALLGKACTEGDLTAVKRAIAAGADPDKRAHKYVYGSIASNGCTAVVVAAYNGNVRELRFLLAATGADPNIDGGSSDGNSSSGKWTPCAWACANHDHDCVRVLLALGAAPDHSAYTDDSDECTCPGDLARR